MIIESCDFPLSISIFHLMVSFYPMTTPVIMIKRVKSLKIILRVIQNDSTVKTNIRRRVEKIFFAKNLLIKNEKRQQFHFFYKRLHLYYLHPLRSPPDKL